MLTPAFYSTILIANHALIGKKVPRDIVVISTNGMDLSNMKEDDVDALSSPRQRKDGSCFYLSNGIVSWINCDTEDWMDSMEWDDEVDMLLNHGLKFGRDMVRVQWDNYVLYTMDRSQYPVDCDWVSYIGSYKVIAEDCALLWVDPRKMFKGYHLEIIRGNENG